MRWTVSQESCLYSRICRKVCRAGAADEKKSKLGTVIAISNWTSAQDEGNEPDPQAGRGRFPQSKLAGSVREPEDSPFAR